MRSRPLTTSSSSARRAALGVGAALAAACTLAACGPNTPGSGGASGASGSPSSGASASAGRDDGAPAAALSDARTATVLAKSARMTLAVDTAIGGKKVATDADGLTSLGGGNSARGDFTVSAAGRRTAMRVLGTTLYVKLPDNATTRQLSGGKLWIKVDTAKLASGLDMSTQVPDVDQQLAYLDHAKKVTEVGSQTVDGVRTTHYRATVAPPHTGGAVGLPSSVPVDVWVDAQHHIRQEKLTVPVTGSTASPSPSASSAGRPVEVAMTMRLSDFGTAVHVTAPPAGQVTDATSQLSKAAG